MEVSGELDLEGIKLMRDKTFSAPGSLALLEALAGYTIICANNARLVSDSLSTALTRRGRFPPPFLCAIRVAMDMTCAWERRIQQARVREQNEAKLHQGT